MLFYTIQEVAEMLKVEPDTISKWIQSGRLNASRLSGSKMVRISEDHIKQFYNENAINVERRTK